MGGEILTIPLTFREKLYLKHKFSKIQNPYYIVMHGGGEWDEFTFRMPRGHF